jgi:hypothetical protein
MLGAEGRCECDHLGCGAVRRDVNNWCVVTESRRGVCILHWAHCTETQIKTGKHFCGQLQAFIYASSAFTAPRPERDIDEATHTPHAPLAYVVAPVLNRDGSSNVVAVKAAEITEE